MPAVDVPEKSGVTRYRFVITTPDSPWPMSFDEELADESAARGRAQTVLDQLALVYGTPSMVVVETDCLTSFGTYEATQGSADLATKENEMATKDPSKDIEAAKNMSTGGHLGGTKIGQQPDAKTSSTVENKGRKERPNNGQED